MINFDRVADIYDATRTLPEGVDEAIADAIVAATNAGPATRFLELGVGTGRIALPLIRRGFPFTGVDISEQMLDRLRRKAGNTPNLTLIQGDITQLPLPDVSQNVVLAVHVLHLVPDWRQAFSEALRVLTPGGYFIYGGNSAPDAGDRGDWGQIRSEWGRLVREMGAVTSPRHAEWPDIQEAVTEQGGRIAVYRVASWMREFRPIDLMERMRRQTFSASWSVPPDVLEAVHAKLLAWGKETYGDLEATIAEPEEFLLHICRFDV
jgi:ubiquinone/menaquinone biosynthesis C-methylase UbiE